MWCYFCLLRARGVRSASRLVVSLIRLPRCYYYTTCKWCMESHLSSDAGVLLALVPWPLCAVCAACVAAGCVREPGLVVCPASWPACAPVAWCCGAVLCPAPWCVGLLCLPCGLGLYVGLFPDIFPGFIFRHFSWPDFRGGIGLPLFSRCNIHTIPGSP